MITELSNTSRAKNFEKNVKISMFMVNYCKQQITKFKHIKKNLAKHSATDNWEAILAVLNRMHNDAYDFVDFNNHECQPMPDVENVNAEELETFDSRQSNKNLFSTKYKHFSYTHNATDLSKKLLNYKRANFVYVYHIVYGYDLLAHRQHWNVKKYIKAHGTHKWYFAKNLNGYYHGKPLEKAKDMFQYRLLTNTDLAQFIDMLIEYINTEKSYLKLHNITKDLVSKQLNTALKLLNKAKQQEAHDAKYVKNGNSFDAYRDANGLDTLVFDEDVYYDFIDSAYADFSATAEKFVNVKKRIMGELMLSKLGSKINQTMLKHFLMKSTKANLINLQKAVKLAK